MKKIKITSILASFMIVGLLFATGCAPKDNKKPGEPIKTEVKKAEKDIKKAEKKVKKEAKKAEKDMKKAEKDMQKH
jgi:outer membrane lipoprotein-sorting protein